MNSHFAQLWDITNCPIFEIRNKFSIAEILGKFYFNKLQWKFEKKTKKNCIFLGTDFASEADEFGG